METNATPVLTEVNPDDIGIGMERRLSANTQFAMEAVRMFIDKGCSFAEVAGWPDDKSAAARAASANTAIHKLGARSKVAACTRTIDGEPHVYLRRADR